MVIACRGVLDHHGKAEDRARFSAECEHVRTVLVDLEHLRDFDSTVGRGSTDPGEVDAAA